MSLLCVQCITVTWSTRLHPWLGELDVARWRPNSFRIHAFVIAETSVSIWPFFPIVTILKCVFSLLCPTFACVTGCFYPSWTTIFPSSVVQTCQVEELLANYWKWEGLKRFIVLCFGSTWHRLRTPAEPTQSPHHVLMKSGTLMVKVVLNFDGCLEPFIIPSPWLRTWWGLKPTVSMISPLPFLTVRIAFVCDVLFLVQYQVF